MNAIRALVVVVAVSAPLLAAAPTVRAQDSCPEWTPGLFSAGDVNGKVYDLLTWDDGTGPAVYAGGQFTTAGSAQATFIARWTGSEWRTLGTGMGGGVVWALDVFDDGGGPALYAGGTFTEAGGVTARFIARWRDGAWSPVAGETNGEVRCFAVWDDGTGPALYVGGAFTTIGGVLANGVARFDGTTWMPLGSGMNARVHSLAAFDDGGGSALYAGGPFLRVDGVDDTDHFARWNGSSWSPVGEGVSSSVDTLAVWDDGTGAALYAGGNYLGPRFGAIARWNGSNLEPLGSAMYGAAVKLHVHDDGTGSRLYVGGALIARAGDPYIHVSRWDGSAWSTLGGDTDSVVQAMASFDDGTGPRLFVGGGFKRAGDLDAEYIASWSATGWTPLSVGGLDDSARALAIFDDGSGPALYVGGEFESVDGLAISRIARWNGTAWSAVGTGLDGPVNALLVHDDGAGPALFAGGEFVAAGPTLMSFISKWDGATWAPLGSGLPSPALALASYDDGTGPALYVGGEYNGAGGSRGVARWDGANWTAIGTDAAPAVVRALGVHDDGTRPVLAVGGAFTSIGGVAARNVALWDGSTWTPLESGTSGDVHSFLSFDDGTGPSLYVGGSFANAGPLFANHIARWDSAGWHALDRGVFGSVLSFTTFDDGTGEDVYAAGEFARAGRRWANAVARWDGVAWTELGMGLDGIARAVLPFDDGSGVRALYTGGDFIRAGELSSNHLARWTDPCADARAGRVNVGRGARADVLFVNDTVGGPSRRIQLGATEPISIFMAPSPASTSVSRFALYLVRGEARPEDRRVLPFGLGVSCVPTPLSGESSRLRAVWNNTGRSLLGVPTLPSTPAPSIVLSRAGGTRFAVTFVLQGIIEDPGSAAARPASVTNAVTVVAR